MKPPSTSTTPKCSPTPTADPYTRAERDIAEATLLEIAAQRPSSRPPRARTARTQPPRQLSRRRRRGRGTVAAECASLRIPASTPLRSRLAARSQDPQGVKAREQNTAGYERLCCTIAGPPGRRRPAPGQGASRGNNSEMVTATRAPARRGLTAERLVRILDLERAGGCHDRAVIGGLDAFLESARRGRALTCRSLPGGSRRHATATSRRPRGPRG